MPRNDDGTYDYGEKLFDAYVVYRELTKSAKNKNTMMRFYEFLSVDGVVSGTRVNWLLSPHAETFYKIWKAQNEIQK